MAEEWSSVQQAAATYRRGYPAGRHHLTDTRQRHPRRHGKNAEREVQDELYGR